jgi:membrane-bound lytic murein transglycosylase D
VLKSTNRLILFGGLALVFAAGCASTPRYRHLETPADAITASQNDPAVVSDDTSIDAEDPAIVVSAPNLGTTLAEAEALYATGVMANIDNRWTDAQIAFEQALTLLTELDLTSSEDLDSADKVERLLDDIAKDYRTTLLALGELPEDASTDAILLRLDQGADTSTLASTSSEPHGTGEMLFDYPIEPDHPKVQKCIKFWQTTAREPFERFLRRSGRYLPMMKEIVKSYNMPTDIAYLPFVESGFNNKAYSYAHASGPWQFIASTGKRYGLDRTHWLDERRDFEKSTHAACQYLSDLYKMFNSWNLALAAYNGGEGRVGRQIKRQKTDDFWKLNLREQTKNYVPLFHAALIIAKDPVSYGFNVELEPPLQYDWVATSKPLELKDVARALGVAAEELEELNPELRRGVTPPDQSPYRFRVPKGTSETFAAIYRDLPRSSRTEWARHTVRRGETLGKIAGRYGVTVADIVAANKLKSKHKLSVGQALVIPVPMAAADEQPSKRSRKSESALSEKPLPKADGKKYTVKSGDTLWDLAKKFGVTTSEIRQANRMGAHEKLAVGADLVIPEASKVSSSNRGGAFWYTVRKGDTVLRIATKFGTTIAQILSFNALDNPNRIHVGQKIRIPQGL